MVHLIGHPQRAHEYEIKSQLDHHPDAMAREKNSLGRLPVTERGACKALCKDMRKGFARDTITVKETTSIVGIIQSWWCPPER